MKTHGFDSLPAFGFIGRNYLCKANPFIGQSEAAFLRGGNLRVLSEKQHARELDAMPEVQKIFVNGDLEVEQARLRGCVS